MKITVSAPGKIILAGEHAVVYNRPALLTVIDKRVLVTLILNPQEDQRLDKRLKTIKIIDKKLKIKEETTLEGILDFTEKANEEWEEFNKSRDIRILKEIAKEPLDLVKIAIGETILDQRSKIKDQRSDQKPKNNFLSFELEIESEIPIGKGMGSSAALVVAVVGAVYYFLNKLNQKSLPCRQAGNIKDQKSDQKSKIFTNNVFNKADLETIHQIAINAERKIHGNPSGGDTAAAVYGGTIWFKKNPDGSRTITPFQFPKEVYSDFTIIDSGKPLETTGEMVGEVRKKIKARPRWGKEMLNKIEESTKSLKEGLENKNKTQIAQAIFRNERCLEKIGVVSHTTKEIIRKLKDFGIAAKVTGAGGKRGNSGMVLFYSPLEQGSEIIKDLVKKTGVEVLAGEFGGEGLRNF